MKEVTLFVNENAIPLNDFIKNILANMTKGFVNSLKNIPEDVNSINVKIEF